MIEEVKRFILVAQEGNVTRAAQKIFITQSALTQSIHRLEKELQTKLFTQKGKQLHLTNEGKSLIVIGEKILRLWENAHDPQLKNFQTPTYTIGMFDNVALRLGEFLQSKLRSENYKLELTIDSSGKLMTQLQLGALDATLCIVNKTFQLPSPLTLVQKYSEELLPVSSKKFSGKISAIPFILYNRGSHTRNQIDEIFLSHKTQPLVYAESTSVTFMRELALLGGGVALLPKNFVKQDLDQGILKIQKMPLAWKREYGLFVQKNGNLPVQLLTDLQKALDSLS